MSRKCHNRCFNSSTHTDSNSNSNISPNIDRKCLSSCYHKYINAISTIKELSFEKGKRNESEFINVIYELRRDQLMDLIWAKGGSKMMPLPFLGYSVKYMTKMEFYPYKGYSPFNKPEENQ